MKRVVALGPEHHDWLYLLVEAETGIEYHSQYGGSLCCQGSIEGYLRPLELSQLSELRSIFEVELGGTGTHQGAMNWPTELLTRLERAVESISFECSHVAENLEEQKVPLTWQVASLSLDPSRIVDEAWLSVLSSEGPGVLVWSNSD